MDATPPGSLPPTSTTATDALHALAQGPAAADAKPAPEARPAPTPTEDAATDTTEPADTFRMVALGDSLTAGTQDAVTIAARQDKVYAKQLADQVGVEFNMPSIDGNGIPFPVFAGSKFNQRHVYANTLRIAAGMVPLGLFTYYIGTPWLVFPAWRFLMGERSRDSRDTPQRPQGNFAVPGFEMRHLTEIRRVKDFLRAIHEGSEGITSVGGEVPLTDAILNDGRGRVKGSEVEQAVAANPDLVMFWCGGNDALSSVFSGYIDDRTLTPVEDKQWNYLDTDPITSRSRFRTTDDVVPGFRSAFESAIAPILDQTSAEVMLMNVPEVTVIPNLFKIGEKVGDLPFRVELFDGTDVTDRIENWVIPNRIQGEGREGRTEFPAGSTVAMATVLKRFVEEGAATMNAEEFDDLLDRLTGQPLFGENEVMDPQELEVVAERIQTFNQVLAEAAAGNPRLHLVDTNEIMQQMKSSGRPLRGDGDDVTVTTGFTGVRDGSGRDGIFSFDGVHPSDTGHAVIANVVLDRIKADLGGDARFERFRDAAPIDEKAVYRSDPHLPGGMDFRVILAPDPDQPEMSAQEAEALLEAVRQNRPEMADDLADRLGIIAPPPSPPTR